MTIETVPFATTKELFDQLEELALSNEQILFRGHRDASWKVDSTLSRYTTTPLHTSAIDLEENLLHFMYKMLSIGRVPFDKLDRRSVLEFARHHGVPTPVIDFSWSPYVAAYFALGDVRWKHGSPPTDGAIIALRITDLASAFTRLYGGSFHEFLYEDIDFLKHEFPSDTLKFIWHPASWNTRMQRQQGSFLYDSLDYKRMGAASFEDVIQKIKEPSSAQTGKPEPTMTKFLVPHHVVGEIIARLELTNVNGTNLLDIHGVASDIMSNYNHNRKTGFTWDLKFA